MKITKKGYTGWPTKKGYTGWPRKNATPTISDFKTTRDRLTSLCALLGIEFFSQQDDTKIINSNEGILRQCHFQNLPLLPQKSQLTYRKIPLFGFSGYSIYSCFVKRSQHE